MSRLKCDGVCMEPVQQGRCVKKRRKPWQHSAVPYRIISAAPITLSSAPPPNTRSRPAFGPLVSRLAVGRRRAIAMCPSAEKVRAAGSYASTEPRTQYAGCRERHESRRCRWYEAAKIIHRHGRSVGRAVKTPHGNHRSVSKRVSERRAYRGRSARRSVFLSISNTAISASARTLRRSSRSSTLMRCVSTDGPGFARTHGIPVNHLSVKTGQLLTAIEGVIAPMFPRRPNTPALQKALQWLGRGRLPSLRSSVPLKGLPDEAFLWHHLEEQCRTCLDCRPCQKCYCTRARGSCRPMYRVEGRAETRLPLKQTGQFFRDS